MPSRKSLDRVMFLYSVIQKVRLGGAGPSVAFVHISKSYKMCQNIVRFNFFHGIAKRFIVPMELFHIFRSMVL